MVPMAKTPRDEREPRAAERHAAGEQHDAAPTSAEPTGHANARHRLRGVARRQAITGPMPIRKSSAMPSGAFTRLKNGGPTVIFTPRTHSEMTGNTVPQNTAKAMPTRTRLLNRNAASREKNDSMVPAVRSSGSR